MKKLFIFLLSILLLIPTSTVFAMVEADNVETVEINARFISDGVLKIVWDDPVDPDFDYLKLFKSTENSNPDEEVLNGSNAREYTEDPATEGVAYYKLCFYTTLDVASCSATVATHGKNNTILEPIVGNFDDIDGHWGMKYIEKLRVLNVVEGDGEGNFEPNRNIYRAEAIKIMMLAFGIGGISCHSEYFPDLGPNDWFCDVVSKAFQAEYVEGDNGYLYPGREITRAEAVKIVLSILDVPVPTVSVAPFEDVSLDAWYTKFVAKAKELGIVEGVGEGKFEPNRSITRAELSKIAAEAAKL